MPTNTATLTGHTEPVRALALNATTLYSASYDQTIKVWNITTNTNTATLTGHSHYVIALALHNTTLVSGSDDRSIKVWDISDRVRGPSNIHTTDNLWKLYCRCPPGGL